jgi:hypothetical protein
MGNLCDHVNERLVLASAVHQSSWTTKAVSVSLTSSEKLLYYTRFLSRYTINVTEKLRTVGTDGGLGNQYLS